LNIGARALHLFAAISWFSVILMLLAGARLLSREAWDSALERLSPSLPKILGATWALLSATGIFLAINNAPNRAPGLIAPDALLRLPWGREYLIAFIVKMLMVAGGIGVGVSIGYVMRKANTMNPEHLERLAAFDLIVGLFIFADVVVIGYMHNLAHLGLLR
jgi:putative copper export protein